MLTGFLPGPTARSAFRPSRARACSRPFCLFAATADAAPSFRSVSSNEAGGGTLWVPAPFGVQSGDVLLYLATADGPAAFTPPAGWTTIYASNTSAGYSVLAYKVATGADSGATYSVSIGCPAGAAAAGWRPTRAC